MKKYRIPLLVIVTTLVSDILTKSYIVTHFDTGRQEDFLNGFLRIALVYNEGGVFGIAQGYKNVFLAISIIVLILMIVYYWFEKNKTVLFSLAMSLIMSGAIGNIVDRLIPGRRGVVDFISIGVDSVYRWPSFNIADSCIVIGAFLLVCIFWRDEIKRRNTTTAA